MAPVERELQEMGTETGIRVRRRPDGSLLLENTGRGSESPLPRAGQAPVERRPPEEPEPRDVDAEPGLEIERLPTDDDLPEVERLPPPQRRPQGTGPGRDRRPADPPPAEPPPGQGRGDDDEPADDGGGQGRSTEPERPADPGEREPAAPR
jgi:hypothetical protein